MGGVVLASKASTKPPPLIMPDKPIYHHFVQYRWSTYRGSAKTNHYWKGYAISSYNTIEELTLDNVNFAFAVKQLGLKGRKFTDLRVVEIYESAVVGSVAG
tara:strand:- start:426 stop:728 length:303 start_codon:yes stop_codon:yes gene_type:complete